MSPIENVSGTAFVVADTGPKRIAKQPHCTGILSSSSS